jgi:Tol biopolymer transport system component
MFTDGARIYVPQFRPEGLALMQVSVTGGETSPIPTTIKNILIHDISGDHSQLLASNFETTGSRSSPLWALPLPAGSPRRVGNIDGSGGAWSRDGRSLVFIKNSDLFLANADGANPHPLTSVQGSAFAPRFSPDGSRIRFSVADQSNASSLWEVRADGSNLHRLLPESRDFPWMCWQMVRGWPLLLLRRQ